MFSFSDFVSKPSTKSKPDQMVVMGPFGSGKTYFAASASEVDELAPILIVDVEGSTTGTVNDFDDDRVDIIDIKKITQDNNANLEEGEQPVDEFEVFMEVMKSVLSEDHGYNTVVIDTLDVANQMALDYFTNPNDGFAKWVGARDYFARSGGLIDRLKSAPFLSILAMHIKEDDTRGTYDFAWDGSGARAALGQFPDLILYINRVYHERKKEFVTKIVTAPTQNGQGKNRFLGKIPAVIEGDLRMRDIWAMLENNN